MTDQPKPDPQDGDGLRRELLVFVSSQRQFDIDPEVRDAICNRIMALPACIQPTTPPVRGDRQLLAETIHKARFSADRTPTVFASEDANARAYCFRIADAILSLPVQPGAGEREVDKDRLIACMALALQTTQGALQHTNNSPEALAAALSSATIALGMEAEHWQKYASRQPPHPSSAGERR